ncbi:hypothetical protein COY89_04485 [Candidatus Roizmanbacteria bacterium CG_4_10_14_0_8_um_filter_36_36]|nr:MAG: hypothetical protein COS51_00920 [Candidatus Roizmanbacteria bacterium CG03_land_8_20_14_0_80_36_21]PIY69814.1 MAG: hypothetical protein COY89_04485 [Candidatus Roizmanbacteria bacterium CG_4_10_14_0_8_um_filter_36_36]PJA52976.1 MAG: hypothetical protein CO166_03515 [Candidatus Roizmanbacteria bacterium CG_4_9_14_3_um_filter_36_11]
MVFHQRAKIILDQVKKNNFLRSNFYFTGRTALSYFYLKHRYSEDFDFFSLKKFDNQILISIVKKWADELDFTYQTRFEEVINIFNFNFKNGQTLKIDFGFYPYRRIEKGIIDDRIEIDSQIDIAVNKLLSINQRNNIKDFVDLYFLLKKYSIYDLIEELKVKFRIKTDPWLLASDFVKIDQFETLPRMIIPITLDELKHFFREKAKELGTKAVEK